jgi:hypothetical protein
MSHFYRLPLFFLSILCLVTLSSWGFFAHKSINFQAVFSLPQDLLPFYKSHSLYLSEHAVDADKRRYILKTEACKHYIDLDHYPEITQARKGMSYAEAREWYGEDTLNRHGTLPWNILRTMNLLEQAFRDQDAAHILRHSADLGHYLGDAHVPLHTTSNYNGQYTQQHGIHGLWESRLPELYYSGYDLWVGQAAYLKSPYDSIWKCIFESHGYVNSVLQGELQASRDIPEHKKYSIHYKNGQAIKTYSKLFCKAYQKQLDNMVEERLRKSIKLTADCWYTCWVNAGKPILPASSQEDKKKKKKELEVIEECIH